MLFKLEEVSGFLHQIKEKFAEEHVTNSHTTPFHQRKRQTRDQRCNSHVFIPYLCKSPWRMQNRTRLGFDKYVLSCLKIFLKMVQKAVSCFIDITLYRPLQILGMELHEIGQESFSCLTYLLFKELILKKVRLNFCLLQL